MTFRDGDITINSIAEHPDGTIIDPYGGVEDLKNKVLRHTSKAFKEDPIRVLRLARFSARFPTFSIAPETQQLVLEMRPLLKDLHKDRVWLEVEKALKALNSHIFYQTLLELDVLDLIFPSIYELSRCTRTSRWHRERNVFIHTMMVLKGCELRPIEVKLAAIYHDIAKPICYATHGTSFGHDDAKLVTPLIDLKIPSSLLCDAILYISEHIRIFKVPEMRAYTIVKLIRKLKTYRNLKNLLDLATADTLGRIADATKELPPGGFLMKCFEDINGYSPVAWIKEHESASGEDIRNHIMIHDIDVVKQLQKAD